MTIIVDSGVLKRTWAPRGVSDFVLPSMLLPIGLLALFGLCIAAPKGADPDPPVFDGRYTVTGYLVLPYAELSEQFTAYYDPDQAKSRIDYYNGVMLTYQIAKSANNAYSTQYKVVWSPDKDTHKPTRVCYQANGTDEGGAIQTQNVLPKTVGMKFVREEPCNTGSIVLNTVQRGRTCQRFELVTKNGAKKNTYTLWVTRSGDFVFPIRYVMMGYNSLLGSHYDKYEVIYTSYSTKEVDPKIFDVYSEFNGECVPFPEGAGSNVKHHHHLTNPMQEFINHDDRHVHEQFELFKQKHGKQYGSEHEHELRKNHFRQNLRYINSINRSNKTFTVAMNHLGDKSSEELRQLRGLKHTLGTPNSAKPFDSDKFSDSIPDSMDWRLQGAVTPVKDQAVCGSCWSFGTTGVLEGQIFLRTDKGLVTLAEQQLIDCSWNQGNGGCDGGEDWRAYDYIKKYGISASDDYGSYMGIDGKCHDGDVPKILETIQGYVNVTGVDDLRKAIANVGPISVGIDASHKSLSFYSNGVYYEPECRNDVEGLDHAVLAVGYGTLNGEPYWLIKNSWSTYWGNDGYVLMSQKDNNCGVATAASYPEF